MNKINKNIFIPAVILIPSLLIYLFLPLTSEEFILIPDEALLHGKQEYLQNEQDAADSGAVNILWLIVDDLGMADTDLYSDGPVLVPNLRRLASRGVKFTNAYVSAPVCSPSRAAIMTGRYNQRFGYEHQLHERYLANRLEYYAFNYLIDSGPWEPQFSTSVPDQDFIDETGLPESEITLAEALASRGYRSGYFGKWHLGKKDRNSPLAFGFDEFYGFMASHSLYVPEGTEGYIDQHIPEDFTDKYIWEGQRDGLHAIRRNDETIQEDRYLTDAITDETIAFLEKNRDKPFYCVTSWNAPHTPLQAPTEYGDRFSHITDPYKRVHYAMISALDDAIGKLLDYLDESGLSENTLIFLISDNGGAEYNLTTDNGPFQGGKITNFEGGVKVPMLMAYPGVVPEDGIYEPMVHATDLFVTSAAVAGIQLPDDRLYDGKTLTEAVNQNTAAHQYLYFKMGMNGGIRSSDWKLTWNEHNGDSSLHRISSDPYEHNDVFETYPEVVSELTRAFRSWAADNKPPAWPPVMFYHYTDVNGEDHYFDE